MHVPFSHRERIIYLDPAVRQVLPLDRRKKMDKQMETDHFDLIPPVKATSHRQVRHLVPEGSIEQTPNDQLWDEEDPPPVESSPPDIPPSGPDDLAP